MPSPDELTFGNSVAAIHDVDALTTWRCRHPLCRATQRPSEYGYQAGRSSLTPRLAPDLTEVPGAVDGMGSRLCPGPGSPRCGKP
jgi:hypothetical protein